MFYLKTSFIWMAAVLGLACQFFIFDSGLFSQMDVILTSALSDEGQLTENITMFSVETERIYCVIKLGSQTGGVPVRSSMVIKWYHNSTEITGHYLTAVDTLKPITVWLEPVGSEQFESGDYSVEIFLQDKLVRTVDFQIK